MNRLNDQYQELQAQWRQVSNLWTEARTKWRDQIRADFERQHWQPLENQIKPYFKALEDLCGEVQNTDDW